MNEINLLMAANNHFFNSMCCTLLSIKNHSKRKINFFFAGNISNPNRKKLYSYVDNVTFIDDQLSIILNELKDIKKPNCISIEALVRVFAPFFLDVDYLLWLDADTIVVKDIDPLYDNDFSKVALGVFEKQNPKFIINKIIKEPFNSGVLLINVAKYKSIITINKLINFIKTNNDYLRYYDQDILNVIFDKSKQYISYDYNTKVVNRILDRPFRFNHAIVLHYWGKVKPWQYKYFSFFHKSFFWRYGIKVFGFKYYIKINLINYLMWPYFLAKRIVFKIGAE